MARPHRPQAVSNGTGNSVHILSMRALQLVTTHVLGIVVPCILTRTFIVCCINTHTLLQAMQHFIEKVAATRLQAMYRQRMAARWAGAKRRMNVSDVRVNSFLALELNAPGGENMCTSNAHQHLP